jgi:hypothetical protein
MKYDKTAPTARLRHPSEHIQAQVSQKRTRVPEFVNDELAQPSPIAEWPNAVISSGASG